MWVSIFFFKGNINPKPQAFSLGTFLNPSKYHTAQHPISAFFVCKQSWDIKPQVDWDVQYWTPQNFTQHAKDLEDMGWLESIIYLFFVAAEFKLPKMALFVEKSRPPRFSSRGDPRVCVLREIIATERLTRGHKCYGPLPTHTPKTLPHVAWAPYLPGWKWSSCSLVSSLVIL